MSVSQRDVTDVINAYLTDHDPRMSGTASQCQRVIAVLRDGRPHTASDIHRAAGTMRLNSRVSELRKRGHVIICRHIAGAQAGPDAYEYVLEAPEVEAA